MTLNCHPPEKLAWKTVPGTAFYQVFIRDQRDNYSLIYTSSLLVMSHRIESVSLLQQCKVSPTPWQFLMNQDALPDYGYIPSLLQVFQDTAHHGT